MLQKFGQSGTNLCLCRASGESSAACVWAQSWEVAAELAPPESHLMLSQAAEKGLLSPLWSAGSHLT